MKAKAMKAGGAMTATAVNSSIAEEWLEGKAGEGDCRWLDGSCCIRVEEKWSIQDWRLLEHEVEEEASNPGTQGREPLHQGALRLQSKASLKDRARTGNEEVEGDGELNVFNTLI